VHGSQRDPPAIISLASSLLLARPAVSRWLVQPTRGRTSRPWPCCARYSLCLALLPAGVAWPPVLLRTPVSSYLTFSPLPATQRVA